MKYDVVEEHIINLQEVVTMAGSNAVVKTIYDNCVNKYMISKQPDLYCLQGQEYKDAKFKMRETCFKETEGLVNLILNVAAEKNVET